MLSTDSESANPFDLTTASFQSHMDRRHANRQVLLQWIREHLRDGVDYGIVPTKKGTPKKSLFKAGAEKLCTLLGATAVYPSFADYEQAALSGQVIEQIIIRCELYIGHERVAMGIGARNTKQDYGDLNKSLKMASKSAMILATLSLAGLSEIFTLDLEDKVCHKPSLISLEQMNTLQARISELGIDASRLQTWLGKLGESKGYRIDSLAQLPVALLPTVEQKLQSFQSQS